MNFGGRRKPVLEEEAFVHVQRTADAYSQVAVALLKRFGLSQVQYNVLRILRGAGENGLPCGEIGARMITRDPDITRLLDRMEARTLVTRERLKTDRRVIRARISEEGLELVNSIDAPILEMHRERLGSMGEERLKLLIELLEEARNLV